jgi:hypothetical protein
MSWRWRIFCVSYSCTTFFFCIIHSSVKFSPYFLTTAFRQPPFVLSFSHLFQARYPPGCLLSQAPRSPSCRPRSVAERILKIARVSWQRRMLWEVTGVTTSMPRTRFHSLSWTRGTRNLLAYHTTQLAARVSRQRRMLWEVMGATTGRSL